MIISGLYIYPIKSLGGIAVSEAVVEEIGFRHDRRFMLVSPGQNGGPGLFITQRTNPRMALLDVAIGQSDEAGEVLRVWHRNQPASVLSLPLEPTNREHLTAVVWNDQEVDAITVSDEADSWFSGVLGQPCRVVFMPATTRRAVDPVYAHHDADGQPSAVSFADGYPYLLIGQASLNDLNQRLAGGPVMEMLRFRPNIVVSGSLPYDEDTWQHFRVGSLDFYGVKPCARCVLTTIDPASGQKGNEPLRTLATYRQWKHKILFGQNVLPDPAAIGASGLLGTVRIGQVVDVLSRQEPWLAPPTVVLETNSRNHSPQKTV